MKDKDGNTNDILAQLEASKPVIKDLYKDLLIEIKGFKYQMTMKILLSKEKENRATEFATVYFTSTAKIVVDFKKHGIDKFFQEPLYRINNWIKKGSAWIIEHINGEYLNISVYGPLSGNTYNELPDNFKNSMKGLIKIKNYDNKCFLWCHVSLFKNTS